MDAPLRHAAEALARGDPLRALKPIALRDDPPALALRGIALAQLGDYALARDLLSRAARRFGAGAPLARARCVVAAAEVALALRDFSGAPALLATTADRLEALGDHANAQHARLLAVRRALRLGRLAEVAALRARIDVAALPWALAAVVALVDAELALRTPATATAAAALARASAAALRAGIPALVAEVDESRAVLTRTAARLVHGGHEQPLTLAEVEALLASGAVVVDVGRRRAMSGRKRLALARRPLLFTLLQSLAQGWPGAVTRDALIARVFRIRTIDESLRARLRVEIGRLRTLLGAIAGIAASADGYILQPADGRRVALLLPAIDGDQGALTALLADGAAWSTSALALALGDSQRSVQRALQDLAAEGRVRSVGRARAQRWLAPPLTEFTTILLLPGTLPAD